MQEPPHPIQLDHQKDKKRAIACISCRKSHLKCEWLPGSTICNRCMKMNLVCTIAPKNKKPKKHKPQQEKEENPSSTVASPENSTTSTTAIPIVLPSSTTTTATTFSIFPELPNLSTCSTLSQCTTMISNYQIELQHRMQQVVAQFTEKQTHIMNALLQWQPLQNVVENKCCSSSITSCCTKSTDCCCSSSTSVVKSNNTNTGCKQHCKQVNSKESESSNSEMDLSKVELCSCGEGKECKCSSSDTLTLCTNFSNCNSQFNI